jgi:hypothetical protein
MRIGRCSKADFDYIIEHIVDFWGSGPVTYLSNRSLRLI